MNKWWGYIHKNGSIQVKRVLWDIEGILQDAEESPFVKRIIPPFPANSRREAIMYITNQLKNN